MILRGTRNIIKFQKSRKNVYIQLHVYIPLPVEMIYAGDKTSYF